MNEVHKIFVAMGATNSKKAKLASYQLKDVAHTLFMIWKNSRALGGVAVSWELLKITFMEIFFPMERMEAKV